MPFTDDDKKRCAAIRKVELPCSLCGQNLHLPPDIGPLIKALLARLEAAENVCIASENRLEVWTRETFIALQDTLRAWRKAAGK